MKPVSKDVAQLNFLDYGYRDPGNPAHVVRCELSRELIEQAIKDAVETGELEQRGYQSKVDVLYEEWDSLPFDEGLRLATHYHAARGGLLCG